MSCSYIKKNLNSPTITSSSYSIEIYTYYGNLQVLVEWNYFHYSDGMQHESRTEASIVQLSRFYALRPPENLYQNVCYRIEILKGLFVILFSNL